MYFHVGLILKHLLLNVFLITKLTDGNNLLPRAAVLTSPVTSSVKPNTSSSARVIKIAIILSNNDSRLFSIRKIRPSIDFAIEQVHVRKILPDDVILNVSYSDSRCNPKAAPVAAFKFIMEQSVDVFFGPICDYSLAPVARYAPYWNLPVISPGGFAHDFGANKSSHDPEFPTLTRMGATFNSLALGIINSIVHYNWTKIILIYDGDGLSEVTPRFCYLAGSALIYYVKNYQGVPFEHDQFLMLPDTDIGRMLQEKVGIAFSSKLLLLFCAVVFKLNVSRYFTCLSC